MTRSRTFGLILVPVIGIAAFFGWQWWSAQADSRTNIITQPVTLGDVEDSVSALGTLQPLDYVDVGTNVSGQLQRIAVEIGDNVQQGQLLGEIDPSLYAAKVNAGEAALLQLRAQVSERQAFRRLAEQQIRRQKQLLDARATSQETYDTAEATLQQTAAQIAALEAQIKQTTATLSGDQANLRNTQILAPMKGTVVSITARRGQMLNANQSAAIVLRIADLDTMTVWTQVSEADVAKLNIGMPAYFTTLGRPDRKFYGTLRQILPTPEVVNNVVLYNALFDIGNPDHDLMPQMSAQVFFVFGEARGVPVVPASALRRIPGRRAAGYVLRVMENGQPVDRQVEVGVVNRLSAEIKSGVKAGDEVVVEGGDARRGGTGGPTARPRL